MITASRRITTYCLRKARTWLGIANIRNFLSGRREEIAKWRHILNSEFFSSVLCACTFEKAAHACILHGGFALDVKVGDDTIKFGTSTETQALFEDLDWQELFGARITGVKTGIIRPDCDLVVITLTLIISVRRPELNQCD